MAITFDELITGFSQIAEDLRSPKEPLLDFREGKTQRQSQYWSAIVQIQFRPASIGSFSPGRGRPIRLGDRYGQATGATRRATTSGFSIQSQDGAAELVMGTGQPVWAKYFDNTLRKRRIGQFQQGVLGFTPVRDNEALLIATADYVVKTVDDNI